MGLWIRSKDKCTLIKIDNIYMTESGFIRTDKEGMSTCLGKYEHERALEVLNEIQDKLIDKYLMQPDFFVKPQQLLEKKIAYEEMNNSNFIAAELGYNITPITVGTTVYEMPEE